MYRLHDGTVKEFERRLVFLVRESRRGRYAKKISICAEAGENLLAAMIRQRIVARAEIFDVERFEGRRRVLVWIPRKTDTAAILRAGKLVAEVALDRFAFLVSRRRAVVEIHEQRRYEIVVYVVEVVRVYAGFRFARFKARAI